MSSHIPIFSFGEKEYPIHSEEELALILELLSSSKESIDDPRSRSFEDYIFIYWTSSLYASFGP
jgi:hypothetical protein